MSKSFFATLEHYLSPVSIFLENQRDTNDIAHQAAATASTFERAHSFVEPFKLESIRQMAPEQRGNVLRDLFLEEGYLKFSVECNNEYAALYNRAHKTRPAVIAKAYALKYFQETVIPTYEREFGNLDQYRERRSRRYAA